MSRPANGKRPVRVLHLRDSPWVDGPGRTILETAKRIDRARVDYHVGAFVSDPAAPHPLVEALRARELPVHPIDDRGGVGHEMVERLVALLDSLGTEVLHTSEFRSNVLALLCRRRRPTLKLVSTAHGWIANDLRGRVYGLADRLLLRRFDRVILVAHAMRRRLPAWWVADRKVRVLHNALMTDTYGRDVLTKVRPDFDPEGVIKLLNVGRLSAEKGQSMLLEAVAALRSEFPGIRLAIAGTGPLQAMLLNEASRLGIADRVEFLGFVADMPRLYSDSHVLVQSSTTEGLPNVVLEAVYLGVPVVATDVGGTREILQRREFGRLIPSNSVPRLIDGLRGCLRELNTIPQCQLLGRAHIEARFSIEVRTKAQEEIYREIAGCAD